MILNLPSQLTSSFNLGSADFYPSTSGKDKAAQYLMSKFGFSKEESISMGDDDNDLALARVVGHTYIPGFTADSVRKAVEANPLAFTVARHGAFLGTHEVLEMIQELPVGSRRPWLIGSIVVLSFLLLARSRRRIAAWSDPLLVVVSGATTSLESEKIDQTFSFLLKGIDFKVMPHEKKILPWFVLEREWIDS